MSPSFDQQISFKSMASSSEEQSPTSSPFMICINPALLCASTVDSTLEATLLPLSEQGRTAFHHGDEASLPSHLHHQGVNMEAFPACVELGPQPNLLAGPLLAARRDMQTPVPSMGDASVIDAASAPFLTPIEFQGNEASVQRPTYRVSAT